MRGGLRIGVFKADREDNGGIFAPDALERQGVFKRLDLHVLLDGIDQLGGRHQRTLGREQLKLVGNREQILPRHHALLDDLNSLLGGVGHRRPNQLGRNQLRLNQNLAFRQIGRRPQRGDRKPDHQDRNHGDDKEDPAPLDEFPVEPRPEQIAAVDLVLVGFEVLVASLGLKIDLLQHFGPAQPCRVWRMAMFPDRAPQLILTSNLLQSTPIDNSLSGCGFPAIPFSTGCYARFGTGLAERVQPISNFTFHG